MIYIKNKLILRKLFHKVFLRFESYQFESIEFLSKMLNIKFLRYSNDFQKIEEIRINELNDPDQLIYFLKSKS